MPLFDLFVRYDQDRNQLKLVPPNRIQRLDGEDARQDPRFHVARAWSEQLVAIDDHRSARSLPDGVDRVGMADQQDPATARTAPPRDQVITPIGIGNALD